jgi:SAM-dependent methyltransferase
MLAAAECAAEPDGPVVDYHQASLPLAADVEARYVGQARLIVSSSVLEYIPDAVGVIRQMGRLLAKGGRALISVPNRSSWYRGGERLAKRALAHTDWLPEYYLRHQQHQFDQAELSKHLVQAGLLPIPAATRYYALPLQRRLDRVCRGHRGPRTASLLLVGAEKA